jgi:ppGpp synthetase/RelA/SpoT-type nucleotidyltranferase
MAYSGEQINRAGDLLRSRDFPRSDEELREVFNVVSFWRSEHDVPLKNAFEVVQKAALSRDTRCIFAKRLKRTASIASKLKRFKEMDLRTMQDIGGCRAIVPNRKKLIQILRELKQLEQFRWSNGYRIKDYIEKPKSDGYRSVHIVGSFRGDRSVNRKIEIQLRTLIQHYWATALEIVDLFTGQALKSNQGDAQWSAFFRAVSDLFAAMDEIHLFESMQPRQRAISFQKKLRAEANLQEAAKIAASCAKRLKVMEKLEAFAGSVKVLDDQLSNQSGFALLKIDLEKRTLESQVFSVRDSKVAEAEYSALETLTASKESVVAALVSTTAVGGVKEAYPNYFADSSNFVQHLRIVLSA